MAELAPPRRRGNAGSRVHPVPPAGVAARVAAAEGVSAVLHHGRSLTDALAAATPGAGAAAPAGASTAAPPTDPRDAALVNELAYGTLRLLPRLQALAALLLRHPLKPGEHLLEALLLVGLYQLIATRIPVHAAVSATVGAATALGRPWAAGLLNATLRRCDRERGALATRLDADPVARYAFPRWLLERVQAAWPADWQAIVTACNARAPMTLRVNRLRVAPADYAARLAAAGIGARALAGQPAALELAQALPAARLPGFADGLVAVQDAGAQWAAPLLDPRPGERALDACAAPGGKSAHLLEQAGGGLVLTAVDSDPARVATLAATLARLGHQATLVTADATAAAADWPGAPWQRVLLDAPCSATGAIRRHPDIKHLRRPSDLPALAATQAALLDALWPLLAPGGRLLYVTCSLLPEENQGQVTAFLARQRDARALPIAPLIAAAVAGTTAAAVPGAAPPPASPTGGAARGRPAGAGWQFLPGEGGGDGFFYALLGKAPA